jgi:hypothetical protein
MGGRGGDPRAESALRCGRNPADLRHRTCYHSGRPRRLRPVGGGVRTRSRFGTARRRGFSPWTPRSWRPNGRPEPVAVTATPGAVHDGCSALPSEGRASPERWCSFPPETTTERAARVPITPASARRCDSAASSGQDAWTSSRAGACRQGWRTPALHGSSTGCGLAAASATRRMRKRRVWSSALSGAHSRLGGAHALR